MQAKPRKAPQSVATATIPRAGALRKAPTGIEGLDEITGCGKTMLALEFLVRGAMQFGEPGVFMTFEESEAELTVNVRSLGFDLAKMTAEKQIALDYIHIERREIEEAGEYDLE